MTVWNINFLVFFLEIAPIESIAIEYYTEIWKDTSLHVYYSCMYFVMLSIFFWNINRSWSFIALSQQTVLFCKVKQGHDTGGDGCPSVTLDPPFPLLSAALSQHVWPWILIPAPECHQHSHAFCPLQQRGRVTFQPGGVTSEGATP